MFKLNLILTRLPFNWKTPFGYLIATIIISLASLCMLSSAVPTVCIFCGLCWILMEIVKDMTNDLINLKARKRFDPNYKQLNRHFFNMVHDFSDAKQLSVVGKKMSLNRKMTWWFLYHFRLAQEINECHEFNITLLFIWSLITMSMSLLILQLESVEYLIKFCSFWRNLTKRCVHKFKLLCKCLYCRFLDWSRFMHT